MLPGSVSSFRGGTYTYATLEIEENLRRKDLTREEYAKNLKVLATAVRTRLIQEDATNAAPVADGEFLATVAKNPKGGRPKAQDSQQAVADAMGIPRKTLTDAEAYVAALTRYPELARPGVPMIVDIAETCPVSVYSLHRGHDTPRRIGLTR